MRSINGRSSAAANATPTRAASEMACCPIWSGKKITPKRSKSHWTPASMEAGARTSPRTTCQPGMGSILRTLATGRSWRQIVAQHLRAGEERHGEKHPDQHDHAQAQAAAAAAGRLGLEHDAAENSDPNQDKPNAAGDVLAGADEVFPKHGHPGTARRPEGEGRTGRLFGAAGGLPVAGAHGSHPIGDLARDFDGGLLESDVGTDDPQVMEGDNGQQRPGAR